MKNGLSIQLDELWGSRHPTRCAGLSRALLRRFGSVPAKSVDGRICERRRLGDVLLYGIYVNRGGQNHH